MSRRNVERDDAILDLTGRYGIGLRFIYEHLWFPSGNAGNAIQQLLKEGRLITRPNGLGGNRSYYQLSLQENAARGLSSVQAESVEGSRLTERLATLWFATMGKQPRPLLSTSDVSEQFGKKMPPNVSYCVQQKLKKGHVVLRLRLVGENMEPAGVVRWLKHKLSEEKQDGKLSDWLRDRQYGYALLVDDQSLEQTRVNAIKKAVRQAGIGEDAFVVTEFIPTAATLALATKRFRTQLKHKK